MLDYFLKIGYIYLDDEANVRRTDKCPRDIVFLEDADGVIKFYWDYITQLIPIREPDDHELKFIIK